MDGSRAATVESTAGTAGISLRDAFLGVAGALRRARMPSPDAVARLRSAADGTDLAVAVAELDARLDGDEPAAVDRWLTVLPPSADLYYDEARHRFALIDRQAEDGGHVAAWGWSWVAEGCLAAYEATGQDRFAELVVDRFLDLLEHRDDRRGRVDVLRGGPQPTWGVPPEFWRVHARPAFTGGWTVNVDTAGRVTYPVLRLIRLLAAAGSPPDAACTCRIVDECAASLRVFDPDFEEHPDTGAGYYRHRVDGGVEPLNHSLVAGRALMELTALTGDGRAHARVRAMARCFRWALRVDEGGAYVWPYRPVPGRPLPPRANQVWKADVDASFALTCYEHRVGFSGHDLDRFSKTFTRNIALPSGDLNSSISAACVEPLLTARVRPTAKVRAPGVVTWNLFGQWEPAISRRLTEEVAHNRVVFPRGWFTTARTGRAYAQRMLDASPRWSWRLRPRLPRPLPWRARAGPQAVLPAKTR